MDCYCFLPVAKAGPSKNARLSTSQRKKHISSNDETKAVRNTVAVRTNATVSKPTAAVGVILSADNSKDNVILKSPDTGQQTPNRFQGVQSNVKLSPTVDMLERERQELACKKLCYMGRKIHALL